MFSNAQNEVLDEIENNDVYKYFLHSNAPSDRIKSMPINEQVKELAKGIELLSNELQQQVVQNYEHLLKHGNHAKKLENVLNTMNERVNAVVANAENLRNRISVPYEKLEKGTLLLERFHCVSHILRQVDSIQQLYKRLLVTSESNQKAAILYNLEQLTSDDQLNGIDVVKQDLKNIQAERQKLVNFATSTLNQGILNEKSVQIIGALQIFINLQIVDSTIEKYITDIVNECQNSLQSAFNSCISTSTNSKANKGPGTATVGTSHGFRSRVWVELEKLFGEEIYQYGNQMRFLNEAMNQTNLGIKVNAENIFWCKLTNIIEDELNKCQSAIHQMFEDEYPKLLKCYWEMFGKSTNDNITHVREVFARYENAYLANSLAKIMQPLDNMFNDFNGLNTDHIDTLMRSITNELSVALVEESLTVKISRNIGKTIEMFAVKVEQQTKATPEASQVIGGAANSSQQKNVQLANIMYYFQTQLERLLVNFKSTMTKGAILTIRSNLDGLVLLTRSIIHPIVEAVNETIEKIIVTIHQEGDWATVNTSAVKNNSGTSKFNCSPYMRELNQFLSRAYNTYLAHFENKEALFAECNEIAIRSIDLLVRHSTVLHPLSSGGRYRLQADYHQLEQSLIVFCPHLRSLGRPYRLLKSMAHVITLENPKEIVENHMVDSPILYSTILYLLFSFATTEYLTAPHENAKWTVPQLSLWMDKHEERDRLDFIAGALQRYENIVREKDSQFWDPVYPIMEKFLELAISHTSIANK